MSNSSGRISRAELERRWSSVRAAMAESGIDVLITQADAGSYTGYLRYLADVVPHSSSGLTLIFPREGSSTLVRQGPTDGQDISNDPSGQEFPGVSRILSAGYYPSLEYTASAEGAQIVSALRPWSSGTIGVLGSQRVSMAVADAIRTAYPSATLKDATHLVDPVIARKSEEEKTHIRDTAAQQDAVIARVFEEIAPGIRQAEVADLAVQYARELGSPHGFALCASAPIGTPAVPRPGADRVIEKGDLLHLLLETDGPTGFYVHLTRSLVFGKVPTELAGEFQIALDAQQFLVRSAQEGLNGAQVDARYREYLTCIGRPYAGGSYCHGHGYDVMQRPVARTEETLAFGPNMNIGVHPLWVWNDAFIWVCSNFLTSATQAEQLHKFPTELVSR